MQPEAEGPPGGPPWPGARGSGSGAPPNGLSRSKRLYVRAQSVDRVIHSGGDPDQHVQILAHVAHLPDDAGELTRSRDALVVLNQPLRYVAPLRRMQGIIFRGADKLPEWGAESAHSNRGAFLQSHQYRRRDIRLIERFRICQ